MSKETTEATRLQQALALMIDTRETVNTLLKSDNVGEHFQLGFNAKMNVMINQLNMLVGGGDMAAISHTEPVKMQPITEFMGSPINRAERVTPAQLKVQNEEKRLFRTKVNKLQTEFLNLSNEQILDAYGKVDINVLRGVAKLAGVEDFADAEINEVFVDNIRSAMSQRAEVTKTNEKVEADLQEQIRTNEVDLATLKAKVSEVLGKGHEARVREALKAANATKVSELKPEQFADFYKEMDAILNPDDEDLTQ